MDILADEVGAILFSDSTKKFDTNASNLSWDNTALELSAANITTPGKIYTGAGVGVGVAAATEGWLAVKPANDGQITFIILDAEGNTQIQSNGHGILAIRSNIQGNNALEVRGPVAVGDGFAGVVAGPTNGLIVSGNSGFGEGNPDHQVTVGADSDTINTNLRINGATVSSVSSSTPSSYLKVNVNGTDYALALLPLS